MNMLNFFILIPLSMSLFLSPAAAPTEAKESFFVAKIELVLGREIRKCVGPSRHFLFPKETIINDIGANNIFAGAIVTALANAGHGPDIMGKRLVFTVTLIPIPDSFQKKISPRLFLKVKVEVQKQRIEMKISSPAGL